MTWLYDSKSQSSNYGSCSTVIKSCLSSRRRDKKKKGNINLGFIWRFSFSEREDGELTAYIDESQYKLHHGRIGGHSATRQLVATILCLLRHHVPWLLRMCNEVLLAFAFACFSPRAAWPGWLDRVVVCTLCMNELVKAPGPGWQDGQVTYLTGIKGI